MVFYNWLIIQACKIILGVILFALLFAWFIVYLMETENIYRYMSVFSFFREYKKAPYKWNVSHWFSVYRYGEQFSFYLFGAFIYFCWRLWYEITR